MNTAPNSNAQLARRLYERDETALSEAMEVYGGVVLGMACRIVAEPTFAEEVVQDTFLALWRRPGAYDPRRGSLKTFLLGIARNKGIDLVRREKALQRTKDSLLKEAETSTTPKSPNERMEEQQEVRDALLQLSAAQREAIVLAYFGGRTYREVASELGIPEGTVKTRVRDGLGKLGSLIGASDLEL